MQKNIKYPTKIIYHCTATKSDKDIDVSDVDRWHKRRGWSGIGYHYLIRLDGSLELGRDLDNDGDIWEETGAHAYGFNRGTIGICYVGGVDRMGINSDTRTPEQLKTMENLTIMLSSIFPKSEFLGHCDLPGVKKSCPCFDVKEWCKSIGVKPN